ncbi:hypothetical protein BGZ98_003455 [Dissophora globulifera]|nr:hypothetical protein BGZ98_003455 [Dissophora globulifera]
MLEVLEGADLRELQSYLSSKDESRALGNLYRIVTLEGHVKWVCFDHYREKYLQIDMQQFKDVVASNGGYFRQKEGCFSIKLKTSTLAKQFYDALAKVRGVATLDITLEWNATMSDLRTLAEAMDETNVTEMSLRGQHFNRPALDIVNHSRRYDPIVQLMCSGRIHYMRLRPFKSFFQHVSSSSIQMTSQLKELYLIEDVDLGLCFQFFKSKSYVFQRVQVLEMRGKDSNGGPIEFVVRLLHSTIQSARMSVNDLAYLSVDEEALAFNGVLTELSIKVKAPSSGLELNNLLRNNQALTKLRLHYFGSQSAIIERVVNARNECISRNGTSSLHETKVILDLGHPEHNLADLKMTFTFHDDSNAPVISSVFNYSDTKISWERVREMLGEYAWVIPKAELSRKTTDDLLLLLHKWMEDLGEVLEEYAWTIHEANLPQKTTDDIIKLSGNPVLYIDFSDFSGDNPAEDVVELLESHTLEILKTCLSRFASTLRGLSIGGASYYLIEVIMDKYSTRLDFPKLEELEILTDYMYIIDTLKILLDSIPADASLKIYLEGTLAEEDREAEVGALISRIQTKAPNVTILIDLNSGNF